MGRGVRRVAYRVAARPVPKGLSAKARTRQGIPVSGHGPEKPKAFWQLVCECFSVALSVQLVGGRWLPASGSFLWPLGCFPGRWRGASVGQGVRVRVRPAAPRECAALRASVCSMSFSGLVHGANLVCQHGSAASLRRASAVLSTGAGHVASGAVGKGAFVRLIATPRARRACFFSRPEALKPYWQLGCERFSVDAGIHGAGRLIARRGRAAGSSWGLNFRRNGVARRQCG